MPIRTTAWAEQTPLMQLDYDDCWTGFEKQKADALEAQAAATPNEAQEQALNAEADRIEQQAGNADGGMTTSNTPNTSPSTTPPAPAH